LRLNSTILFVPGLRDHVADHWQTQLAGEIAGSRTVPPLGRGELSCAAWVEALDRALETIEGPVVLAAHAAGCITVAHWAQWHDRPIQGALLATPPDIERPLPRGYPTLRTLKAHGWLPLPREPLPFRTILAASLNDPLAQLDRAADLAMDWGGRLVLLGDVGHLEPASGFGPWRAAATFLTALDDSSPSTAPPLGATLH
jgi:predicted alpha/beta hydrolase family esterase